MTTTDPVGEGRVERLEGELAADLASVDLPLARRAGGQRVRLFRRRRGPHGTLFGAVRFDRFGAYDEVVVPKPSPSQRS